MKNILPIVHASIQLDKGEEKKITYNAISIIPDQVCKEMAKNLELHFSCFHLKNILPIFMPQFNYL